MELTPEERDWRHGIPAEKRMGEIYRLQAVNADLLAALKPLVASLEYDIQHGLLFGLVEPTERLLAAARAAIARAKEKP